MNQKSQTLQAISQIKFYWWQSVTQNYGVSYFQWEYRTSYFYKQITKILEKENETNIRKIWKYVDEY